MTSTTAAYISGIFLGIVIADELPIWMAFASVAVLGCIHAALK